MKAEILLSMAIVLQTVTAKRFTPCELIEEFKKQGVTDNRELNEWVCIARHESSFNTRAMNKYNSDGSRDYGMFMISNKYWCQNDSPGHDCHIKCEDLRNEDISDDIQCALQIKKIQGLTAWARWNSKCANKTLEDVSSKC
ncbi:hypothetical protein L9F63_001283 [Diploptera punctata]|uniref:lysozyme n=1 Tax=Diploptera punctata TaxID=6984 RepID=A0AAD8EJV0_DIPPU|nr:hypothetical protein L9F63_001283 [Diploptera punctata]